MSKILLLDDREVRQSLFMQETQIDLSKYADVLTNIYSEESCYKLIDDVLVESDNLEVYDTFMVHKSIYPDKNALVIQKLKDYCKSHVKTLVLFSGGIDTVFFSDKPYARLELNSKHFYSEKLAIFLNAAIDGNANPLILAYGRNWRLNLMLVVLEKINNYIETNEKIDIVFEKFEMSTDLKLLEGAIAFDKPELENGWTDIEAIKKLYANLQLLTHEMVEDND